jgi:hypothetical protein
MKNASVMYWKDERPASTSPLERRCSDDRARCRYQPKLAIYAGNSAGSLAKAAAVGADVAILDLEDAVAPKDKVQARMVALNYLADNRANGALHALRIKGLDTRAGISDLDALLDDNNARFPIQFWLRSTWVRSI